jgi:hypothetical protein
LKQLIEECNDLINVGSKLFNLNEDPAMNGWKVFCCFHSSNNDVIYFPLHQGAAQLEQPNNNVGRISIDLPQTILITSETHGKGV